MTTDTIDLRPIMESAERERRERRDRPAKILMHVGVPLHIVGGLGAFALTVGAWADSEWTHARESLSPLLLSAAVLGGIFIGLVVCVRMLLRGLDEFRAEEREARREHRDRTRADVLDVVASAEVDRVRREHHRQAVAEARHEELRGDFRDAVTSVAAVLARWGQYLVRIDQALIGEGHAPAMPRRRRRPRPRPADTGASQDAPEPAEKQDSAGEGASNVVKLPTPETIRVLNRYARKIINGEIPDS